MERNVRHMELNGVSGVDFSKFTITITKTTQKHKTMMIAGGR